MAIPSHVQWVGRCPEPPWHTLSTPQSHFLFLSVHASVCSEPSCSCHSRCSEASQSPPFLSSWVSVPTALFPHPWTRVSIYSSHGSLEHLASPSVWGTLFRHSPNSSELHLDSLCHWPTSSPGRQNEASSIPYVTLCWEKILADVVRDIKREIFSGQPAGFDGIGVGDSPFFMFSLTLVFLTLVLDKSHFSRCGQCLAVAWVCISLMLILNIFVVPSHWPLHVLLWVVLSIWIQVPYSFRVVSFIFLLLIYLSYTHTHFTHSLTTCSFLFCLMDCLFTQLIISFVVQKLSA